jgi:hypothetical protein
MRGLHGPTQTVGFVPGAFTARINARSSDLKIGRRHALKLLHKHKLRYEHWGLIQLAIDYGYVILERRDLVFVYIDDTVFHDIFVLVVRRSADGEEISLSSLHRCEQAKLRKLLKTGELLREHY